ncbi:flippase [Fervidobacterium pennivorans subsp. carthaginiensis]|uniref:flippase n=1 Tax=Fervidobacterium pennivorans TaxID=93466 RepID=UPI00355AE6D5
MSIAKNYVYNVLLQITNILIPFVTTPYIARVLDPKGIGIAAFTASIVQYFLLFSTFGTNLYGSRAIAYVREKSDELRKTFWHIMYVKLLTGSAGLAAYVVFVLFFAREYKGIYWIQFLVLLASVVDITYFFQGIEEFKKISTRSIIIRIISAGLIFVVVKQESDVVMYVLIGVLGNFFGQLVMWLYVPKHCRQLEIPDWRNIFKHFTGSARLFVPMVAIQIYIVLDKTMTGLLAGKEEVGYYDMAQRLVKILLGVVTSIGPVMLSRISSLVSKNERNAINEYTILVFDFVTYFSLMIISSLFTTIPHFVPIFFGRKFLPVKDLILIISPIILFISWSNLFGIQIMIPFKKEKQFTLSVLTGAIVNFTLNLLLIPRYGALGASIGSVVAEFSVTLSQIVMIKDIIPSLRNMLGMVPKHFISAVCSVCAVSLINILTPNFDDILKTILNGLLTVTAYVFVEYLLKSNINRLVISRVLSALTKF